MTGTNGGSLLIRASVINFNEIWIEIKDLLSWKCILKRLLKNAVNYVQTSLYWNKGVIMTL